jgi:excinuclease ABC subunit B
MNIQSVNPQNILNEVMSKMTREEKIDMIAQLYAEMSDAAEKMEYEKAAYLRDEIKRMEESLGITS